MALRIFTEPQQGASYQQLATVARTAEELGFGAFFRSDHVLKMGSATGLPAVTDAWVTLAGLARDTTTIRLGLLVTGATYRHPSVLAAEAVTVDHASHGRLELAMGAAWFDAEHRQLGIDFPSTRRRFDRLEDTLEIFTRLFTGEVVSYEGREISLDDAMMTTR